MLAQIIYIYTSNFVYFTLLLPYKKKLVKNYCKFSVKIETLQREARGFFILELFAGYTLLE